jgi:hypothetical protein
MIVIRGLYRWARFEPMSLKNAATLIIVEHCIEEKWNKAQSPYDEKKSIVKKKIMLKR